jgi:hypothetical protein
MSNYLAVLVLPKGARNPFHQAWTFWLAHNLAWSAQRPRRLVQVFELRNMIFDLYHPRFPKPRARSDEGADFANL